MHLLCLGFGASHLLRRRVRRQGNQNVRQVVAAGGGIAALGQEALDLGIGHVDAGNDFLLAQLGDAHLAADLLTKILEAAAVGDDCLAHLGQRQIVAGGDVLQREIQFVVADVDAGLVGQLHLQASRHQVLEHLTLELPPRRRGRAPAAQIRQDALHLALEFALNDHVLVDYRNDAVKVGRRCRPRQHNGTQHGEQSFHVRVPCPQDRNQKP